MNTKEQYYKAIQFIKCKYLGENTTQKIPMDVNS